MSNPKQSVTVTVVVESGTTPEERRLSRTEACYTLTGAHSVLLAGFKAHTVPAVLTALATSKARHEGIKLRQKPPRGVAPAR